MKTSTEKQKRLPMNTEVYKRYGKWYTKYNDVFNVCFEPSRGCVYLTKPRNSYTTYNIQRAISPNIGRAWKRNMNQIDQFLKTVKEREYTNLTVRLELGHETTVTSPNGIEYKVTNKTATQLQELWNE